MKPGVVGVGRVEEYSGEDIRTYGGSRYEYFEHVERCQIELRDDNSRRGNSSKCQSETENATSKHAFSEERHFGPLDRHWTKVMRRFWYCKYLLV